MRHKWMMVIMWELLGRHMEDQGFWEGRSFSYRWRVFDRYWRIYLAELYT